MLMVPSYLERIQGIRRFIEVTGAANVGWTEAGLISGNDPHNGSNACAFCTVPRYPVRTDRFYVPSWVEEERQAARQAILDEKKAWLDREKELEIERMIARGAVELRRQAHLRPEEEPVPLEIFELEWDLYLADPKAWASKVLAKKRARF